MLENLREEYKKKIYNNIKNKYIVYIHDEEKAIIRINCNLKTFVCSELVYDLNSIYRNQDYITILESEKLYEHANCFSFKDCTLFDDEDSARLYYEVKK